MNSDTINLLKECNAGCKSATNSMEQVLPFVKNEELKKSITICNENHIKIGEGCHAMLNEGGFEERDPNPISKAFAWASVEMKLMIDDKDEKIARLMMDGCNMGIQSLAGYINQYKDADSKAVNKAKELIEVEQDFMKELLIYL